jgi:uncharacterized protein involved in exopolysaccharide biosynthesis
MEQPFFRMDLRRSLRLHRRLAMGIALGGLLLGAVSVALKWPTYVAQSQVFIQPSAPQVMAEGGRTSWPNDTNSYDTVIQQQMQAVSHPNVLLNTLHKLGPGAYQRGDETEQAAATRLGKAIDAKRLATSYQILISAQAKDAELAAKIANSMAMALVENASEQEKSGDTERLAVLTAEQTRIQKELADDRAEQEELNAKLGTASIGTTEANHYDEDIGSVREALVKARAVRDEAAARLSTMEGVRGSAPQALDAEADEMAATDAGLVSMKTSLNQRRAVLIAQMANLTPNHPLYKQDAAELAQIDGSLDAMMKDLRAKVSARIDQRLHTDLNRAIAVEDRLNGQLAQLAAAAAGATPQLQRASDLATSIARLQSRYSAVDAQVRNLTLEISAPGSAYLSAVASVPTHMAWGLMLKRGLLLAFAGIFLGVLAALIANNLDQKIYIAADVVRVLGIAPMAQLPDFSEVSSGVAEDHLLRLASAIDHACRQGNLMNCIFTGVGPGAGVTTIAGRVQSLLQAMGRDSVLVDSYGVLIKSAASGSGKSSTMALTTMERGGRSATLMEQLDREKLNQESDRGECLVITDTAPLAISAETEYLARHVDAAIMVIEAGVTTRTQLRLAASSLARLDVGAVGFVLNKVAMATADAPFLHTMKAMEEHHGGQNRSLFRPMEPARSLAEVAADEAPREDRSLKQSSARELAAGDERPAEVPVAEGDMTLSREDRSGERSPGRTIPVGKLPAAAPVERVGGTGRPAVEAESASDSKPARPVAASHAEERGAVAAVQEPLRKRSLGEELLQAERLRARPEQSAAPVLKKAEPVKQITTPLRITEIPLTPRERQELAEARLRVEAAAEESRRPVPQQTAAATATDQRRQAPAQPRIAPAEVQPTPVAVEPPLPLLPPLPMGRPVRERVRELGNEQGRAPLEASQPNSSDATWQRQRSGDGESIVPKRGEAKLGEVAGVKTSPLSGLRERSFGEALKNLNRPVDPCADSFGLAEPLLEPAPVIEARSRGPEPSLTDKVAPKVTPASASRVSVPLPARTRPITASGAVTAQPEILPPTPAAAARGKESKGNSDRRDRRDTFDDVEVLPSWRGQYKKR